MVAGPDDLPFGSYLDHRNACARCVTANHSIAIGQSLRATGIFKKAAHVVVRDFPDDFTLGTEFHQLIAMRERDHCIAIIQPDCGEGPVLGFAPTKFLKISFEYVNDLS